MAFGGGSNVSEVGVGPEAGVNAVNHKRSHLKPNGRDLAGASEPN